VRRCVLLKCSILGFVFLWLNAYKDILGLAVNVKDIVFIVALNDKLVLIISGLIWLPQNLFCLPIHMNNLTNVFYLYRLVFKLYNSDLLLILVNCCSSVEK